jgi:hypothetical protein
MIKRALVSGEEYEDDFYDEVNGKFNEKGYWKRVDLNRYLELLDEK